MHMSRNCMAPNGCTCAWSQGTRQWLGHPYPGQPTIIVNPSTTGASPFLFPYFPAALHHVFNALLISNTHHIRGHHLMTWLTPTHQLGIHNIGPHKMSHLPQFGQLLPRRMAKSARTSRGEVEQGVNASGSLHL